MRPEKHNYLNSQTALLGLIFWTFFGLLCPAQSQDFTGIQAFRDPRPELRTALGKAESLATKEQFKQAQEILEVYAAAHPAETYPLLYYELGYFAYKAGDIKSAISNLEKSVDLAPKFKDGWQLLSLAWQETGARYSKEKKQEQPKRLQAMQQSAVAMDRAAQLSGDNDLLYQSAMLWLEAEKAKKALTILEELSRKEHPRQEWLVGLSEALKALKRSEETAEAMEKAARLQNNPELLFHAAYLWHELEQPARALPLLKILAKKKHPEKNWLLLLAGVYNTLNQYTDAAVTFEWIIEVDPAPEYLYNCGVLWLQGENADRALKALLQLADAEPPKADWFVATAQGWLVKNEVAKAADAMERAAIISQKPQHIYQAGVLRLQLEQADRAIKLLTPLATLKKPESQWLVALSNAWLLKENYIQGATYMERAAVISGEGKLYHKAGMLWRVEERLEKAIALLRKSVAVEKVEQLWLIDLAAVLLDADREAEVRPIMKRTNLFGKKVTNQLRYRGVVIWLNLGEPEQAYPLLQLLNKDKEPRYSWMSSLVKTCVELGKIKEAEKVLAEILTRYPSQVKSWKLAVWLALQQANYVKAVAAKEIVRQFEPDEKQHEKDLSRLYLLAGVPQQAARFYTRTIDKQPTVEQLEHLVDIYLSGRRYEQALAAALKIAEKEKTAEHLEALGDIYYALHQYDQSCTIYEQAAEQSASQAPDILMKAAYSAMKARQYKRATASFTEVITMGTGGEEQVQAAMENLAYIEKIKEQRALQH